MAVQWLLAKAQLPSRLVIAMERQGSTATAGIDQAPSDAFHAWVELGDRMVIGLCERQNYRPVLVFSQDDGDG